MAKLHGKASIVHEDTTAIGDAKAWAYTDSVAMADATAMGDSDESELPGLRKGAGSIEVHFDTDDTGQNALVTALKAGSTIELNYYPSGDTSSGADYLTGTVYVTERSINAAKDGVITASFSFSGPMDDATVA